MVVESLTIPRLVRGQWTPMSYAEFLRWAPEGLRTEWTDGEGIVYMSNSDDHQWIIDLLNDLIGGYARVFGLGRVVTAPYPMILWPDGPHREPDVLFVATAHLDRWTSQRLHGPGDLVGEVLSADTTGEDLGRKLQQYAASGIPEYLIVDARPRRRVFRWLQRGDDGRYRDLEPDEDGRYHSRVLPEFWLKAAWFRQDPLPDVEDLLFQIGGDAYDAWLDAKRRAWQQRARGEPDDAAR